MRIWIPNLCISASVAVTPFSGVKAQALGVITDLVMGTDGHSHQLLHMISISTNGFNFQQADAIPTALIPPSLFSLYFLLSLPFIFITFLFSCSSLLLLFSFSPSQITLNQHQKTLSIAQYSHDLTYDRISLSSKAFTIQGNVTNGKHIFVEKQDNTYCSLFWIPLKTQTKERKINLDILFLQFWYHYRELPNQHPQIPSQAGNWRQNLLMAEFVSLMT